YHHHLSWNENLAVPFAALTRYVRQVAAGETLERPTSKLVAERDRIAAEYRALLSTEEDRGAFDQMLRVCRLVFPYVEDHKFYCEHWFTTRFFQKIRAFGELLTSRGVLEEAEDVRTTSDESGRRLWANSTAGGSAKGPSRVARDSKEGTMRRENTVPQKSETAALSGPEFGPQLGAVSDIGGTMSHAAIVARE